MNRFRSVLYSLQDGIYNLRRGGITGVISIITIAFTLLNLGLLSLAWGNISPILDRWMAQVKVVGYLKEGVSGQRIEELQKDLGAVPHVKEVVYISKQEALTRFKKTLGEDSVILDGIDENPLPASFEFIIKKGAAVETLDKVTKELKVIEEFEEIQSGREWVSRLSSFIFLIKAVGVFIGGLLVFVSLFIISNTVRLTFLNRMEEIEIMRLVGATRWFIRIPFLIEGALNGFLGGVFSTALLYLIYYIIRYRMGLYLLNAIGMTRLSFIPMTVIAFLICLGMGVGAIGSLFSLKI